MNNKFSVNWPTCGEFDKDGNPCAQPAGHATEHGPVKPWRRRTPITTPPPPAPTPAPEGKDVPDARGRQFGRIEGLDEANGLLMVCATAFGRECKPLVDMLHERIGEAIRKPWTPPPLTTAPAPEGETGPKPDRKAEFHAMMEAAGELPHSIMVVPGLVAPDEAAPAPVPRETQVCGTCGGRGYYIGDAELEGGFPLACHECGGAGRTP